MEKAISVKDAIELLPPESVIGVFHQFSMTSLVKGYYNKERLVKMMHDNQATLFISGEFYRNQGYGIRFIDGHEIIFVQTDEKKLNKYLK